MIPRVKSLLSFLKKLFVRSERKPEVRILTRYMG